MQKIELIKATAPDGAICYMVRRDGVCIHRGTSQPFAKKVYDQYVALANAPKEKEEVIESVTVN